MLVIFVAQPMIASSPLELAMKQRVIANTQYDLSASDLEVVLALTRGITLAGSAVRLGVDASTIFRALQRLERRLGQRLFERTRSGYLATELATQLAAHAEEVEVALESARSTIEAARRSGRMSKLAARIGLPSTT